MKVRHKLFLSLLFLFGVIILLGGIGTYYLRWLAKDSEAIMKDNNRTLGYMRSIGQLVDEVQYQTLKSNPDAAEITLYLEQIDSIIALQLVNITEPGENELSNRLNHDLKKFAGYYRSSTPPSFDIFREEILPFAIQIKEHANSIYLLNEKSMLLKSELANATADQAVFYMSIFGVISIAVGLAFIIWLPIYISRPIVTFTGAIREIARGNYKIAIPRVSSDEYGELADSFNRMAARLNEYEHSNLARLLREQKRLNAVINQLDEVILGLDENKQIIFANEHCIKLLDMDRHQLIGKYAPDVATQNQLLSSLIRELMSDSFAAQEKNYQSVKVIEDSKEKLFSKNIVEVLEKHPGENPPTRMGYVIILTDITDFIEKDKAKTHFIATLSHELKTPVAAIQMGTNLLFKSRTGPLNEDQAGLITTIENNNKRIGRIINEILDLSKIESGTIDVTLSAESVGQLIEKAIEGVQLFLNDKSMSVKIASNPHLPKIRVDAHKTVWVLNNFLTNAIRYAPTGSEIELTAKATDNTVTIEVIDKGPGIAPENQKRLFQKFTQLVKSENTGTGLGLAISKEFIEAMGGAIGVNSEIGKGSRFWIQMPIQI